MAAKDAEDGGATAMAVAVAVAALAETVAVERRAVAQ